MHMSLSPCLRLPAESKRNLRQPRVVALRRLLPEAGRADIGVERGKPRLVPDIDDFDAELRCGRTARAKVLCKRDIELIASRRAQARVDSRSISERGCRRQ